MGGMRRKRSNIWNPADTGVLETGRKDSPADEAGGGNEIHGGKGKIDAGGGGGVVNAGPKKTRIGLSSLGGRKKGEQEPLHKGAGGGGRFMTSVGSGALTKICRWHGRALPSESVTAGAGT